jgi:hypothetical protein
LLRVHFHSVNLMRILYLWWTDWHWDKLFSVWYFCFTLYVIITPICCAHVTPPYQPAHYHTTITSGSIVASPLTQHLSLVSPRIKEVSYPHQNQHVTWTQVRIPPTSNKLLIYKTILRPIWAYRIQLWGTASTSSIEILQRFQSKTFRMTVDAPWFVPNTVIRKDLQTRSVEVEIRRYSSQHSAHLIAHPNDLIVNLMEQPNNNRRLWKHLPNILPTRFPV